MPLQHSKALSHSCSESNVCPIAVKNTHFSASDRSDDSVIVTVVRYCALRLGCYTWTDYLDVHGSGLAIQSQKTETRPEEEQEVKVI